ncbi:hypothetical protein Bca4012_019829 [Brassica carinata]
MSITEANTVTDRKAISPDDLTSSDNPGVTVFFPLTISTNYDEWATKILMEVLTLSIKKFGSTDKSITEPAASSSTLEVWNGRYSAVRNLLSASIWKDRISLLPDSLLCHILSFLTTKEAVCTSVLSSRWRDLWKWVPILDLVSSCFPSDKVCVDFINEFLLNFKCLSEFKICLAQDVFGEDDSINYGLCIDKVTKRKIQHFHVNYYRDMEISLTLPVCEAVRHCPITEKATEQEVVRYFLGNATSLKKLVLRLNVPDGEKHEPGVLKHRFDSPRRSSLCHFDVLLVVQTSDKMKEL